MSIIRIDRNVSFFHKYAYWASHGVETLDIYLEYYVFQSFNLIYQLN